MHPADEPSALKPLTPVYTAALFPGLLGELVTLLRGLSEDDWARPTVAGAWRVRDVAAHLLDADLRRLSAGRDGWLPPPDAPVRSFGEVVALINRANASGVAYAQRLSPRTVIDLLEVAGRWVADYFAGLPPHGQATWPVAWAGEDRSEHWMDVGREYTERWHHQMQIRDAVGAPGLLAWEWLHPLLHLSVRAFPRAYAEVDAPQGTSVVFHVHHTDSWTVVRGRSEWRVLHGSAPDASARVRVAPDTAWRLLYNALPADAARRRVEIEGDSVLAEPLLRARSVMV